LNKKKIKFFICYAHDNEKKIRKFIEELEQHLKTSKKFEYELWADWKILIGENKEKEIQNALNKCDFGLLLLSLKFLNYDIAQNESLKLLKINHALPIGFESSFLNKHHLKNLESSEIFLYKEIELISLKNKIIKSSKKKNISIIIVVVILPLLIIQQIPENISKTESSKKEIIKRVSRIKQTSTTKQVSKIKKTNITGDINKDNISKIEQISKIQITEGINNVKLVKTCRPRISKLTKSRIRTIEYDRKIIGAKKTNLVWLICNGQVVLFKH